MRADQPHRAERALPEKPLISPEGRAELLGALLALAIAAWLLPPFVAWITAETERIQTSARGGCRPPAEAEQLHIIVRAREGRLVTECMYVGGQGRP